MGSDRKVPFDLADYVARVKNDIAPLPPGTPYEEQQFHALMSENGVIPWSPGQARDLATRIREALAGA